jgi:threonine/homoserine/homoserine lactone efflux protein
MWIYLIQGVGYGLAAASQPGPFQTYVISQTLTRGWKRTLPAAFAPLVSDGPIILICVLLLSQVPIWLQRFLYIAGGLFVLYLAYGTFNSYKNFNDHILAAEAESKKSIYKAVFINFLSPGPYIYWSLVTGPILLKGWRETPFNGIGFLAGFYLTLVLSVALVIFIFGTAARLGPKVNRILLGISAIALFCFGLYQLWLGLFNG